MSSYLRLSVCVLYSMMVLGGRFRTRFIVSRIRVVVTKSLAVRFHSDKMSSYNASNSNALVQGHIMPPLTCKKCTCTCDRPFIC